MAGEAVTRGCVLDHFAENQELSGLIAALPHVCTDQVSLETSQERVTFILDEYQEQPHLLDPYLESLIEQLFALTRQPDAPPILMHQAFKYLYLISKVRGSKVVVRWFSHEVADLEPVLSLLQQQDRNSHETWETRYILLLWLSMVVIIPFDLSRMDGRSQPGEMGVVDRVITVAKGYLSVGDKCRDAAALLLGKFLSRPDVKRLRLAEFLDWCLVLLNTVDNTSMQGMTILAGVLSTLASLFKHGRREDVLEFTATVLQHLAASSLSESDNTLLRKLSMKLAQRLGMTFLPARVALWRYQRGGRSLEETLASSHPSHPSPASPPSHPSQQDDHYDVPEEIEEVLGLLLAGLRDRDTVVRWSAAKGVGRITARLPRELADEVVGSLLDCFSVQESDTAWHGGCLALAELGRRGLLLPHRLPEVVPVVLRALCYDERRGTHSVGSHVRDAACYVCWSFARAYEAEDLRAYVTDVARGLLIMTVFDREVNCRRAASAAFQENVGRQGAFPHGIDILTTADYFAVGSRTNAYLNISVYVAQFAEYTQPLIEHLVSCKLGHWDSALRELSAQALRSLAPRSPAHMAETVLPSLLPLVTTPDTSLRHGALHAVAELTFGLYEHAQEKGVSLVALLGQQTIDGLVGIATRLRSAEVFKGVAGEIMRPAALKFITNMCLVGLPVEDRSVNALWRSIIEENLPHLDEGIRDCAVTALASLCEHVYSRDDALVSTVQEEMIPRYITRLTDPLHVVRMGFSLGLGALSEALLQGTLMTVLNALMAVVTDVKASNPKFTEARRDAVRALTRVCSTVGVAMDGSCDHCVCPGNVAAIFGCLFNGLKDYTTDSRGDIGAVVREASMNGIETLLSRISSMEPGLLTPAIVEEAMQRLVQQSNEKIDRTRALACTKLMTIIHTEPPVPHVPQHAELKKIFDKTALNELNWKVFHQEIVSSRPVGRSAQATPVTFDKYRSALTELNWAVPQFSFRVTTQLLALPSYLAPSLLGLVVSVGGLTESTVRQSSASLLSHLKGIARDFDSLNAFTDCVIEVLTSYCKDDRVVVPMFKTLDLMLSNGVFDLYATDTSQQFPSALLTQLKLEVKKCRDAKKLLASIDVFCGLLQFEAIRSGVLGQVVLLLCHAFPRIRKTTADQFYITMVTYDGLIDEDISDEVFAILTETAWDGDLPSVREQRNRLCDLFKLPRPKPAPAAPSASQGGKGGKRKARMAGDLTSYRDLVDRAGY